MPIEKDIQCFIIINSDFEARIKDVLLDKITKRGIVLKNIDTLEFNCSDYDIMRKVIDDCIEEQVASLSEISINND